MKKPSVAELKVIREFFRLVNKAGSGFAIDNDDYGQIIIYTNLKLKPGTEDIVWMEESDFEEE